MKWTPDEENGRYVVTHNDSKMFVYQVFEADSRFPPGIYVEHDEITRGTLYAANLTALSELCDVARVASRRVVRGKLLR